MAEALLVMLLNGPLGVGKSTLGELLGETLDRSVSLDGDSLVATNPPPDDELGDLHLLLERIVSHRAAQGYRSFIINHYWSCPAQIADLHGRLGKLGYQVDLHCFRLTLPKSENLKRIILRRGVRAIDESDLEDPHFAEEFAHLSRADGTSLGIPFDASDRPELLVERMLAVVRPPAQD